jgi:hypothetical protein
LQLCGEFFCFAAGAVHGIASAGVVEVQQETPVPHGWSWMIENRAIQGLKFEREVESLLSHFL